jgi:hypothetical protein
MPSGPVTPTVATPERPVACLTLTRADGSGGAGVDARRPLRAWDDDVIAVGVGMTAGYWPTVDAQPVELRTRTTNWVDLLTPW